MKPTDKEKGDPRNHHTRSLDPESPRGICPTSKTWVLDTPGVRTKLAGWGAAETLGMLLQQLDHPSGTEHARQWVGAGVSANHQVWFAHWCGRPGALRSLCTSPASQCHPGGRGGSGPARVRLHGLFLQQVHKALPI